jgi:hypothetical protein
MINNNTISLCVTVPSDVYCNRIEIIQKQLGGIMLIAYEITINIINIYFIGTSYYRINISAAVEGAGREVIYKYMKQIQNIMEEEE